MSNILDQFTVVAVSNGGTHDDSHLQMGCQVAITEEGLSDHNTHNMCNRIGLCAGVGLVALPVAIGGGIGIAMGGEAIGLGLAELGLTGAAGGAMAGAVTRTPVKGYLRDDKHTTLSLVDMVGTVINRQPRWWDQIGHDLRVRWVGADEYGNRMTFTAWHNPEQLVKLAKQGV